MDDLKIKIAQPREAEQLVVGIGPQQWIRRELVFVHGAVPVSASADMKRDIASRRL